MSKIDKNSHRRDMTNDYDTSSKGMRLAVAKRNRTSGDLFLIDPHGTRTRIFEMKYSPASGSLLKERRYIHDDGARRVVGVRRAVSRGKAAIRLAFLTVSDGC